VNAEGAVEEEKTIIKKEKKSKSPRKMQFGKWSKGHGTLNPKAKLQQLQNRLM
jgi:hypothetical protein